MPRKQLRPMPENADKNWSVKFWVDRRRHLKAEENKVAVRMGRESQSLQLIIHPHIIIIVFLISDQLDWYIPLPWHRGLGN